MKIEIVKIEPVIKLELTVNEFNNLRAAYGQSNEVGRKQVAERYGWSIKYPDTNLWASIKNISIN